MYVRKNTMIFIIALKYSKYTLTHTSTFRAYFDRFTTCECVYDVNFRVKAEKIRKQD